jgi:hypothetical protein
MPISATVKNTASWHAVLLAATAAALCGCGAPQPVPATDPLHLSDAPQERAMPDRPVAMHGSYAQALAAWRGPEDVNAWIGANFEYDVPRAIALSESRRAAGGTPPSIHEPAAFYEQPVGICVDLARFGVETLKRIDPALEPRYLMIEFEPARISGQVLRRHWVASFFRGGEGYYFFADSKRPGVMAGPYPSVEAFIAQYASYRRREVLAFRQLESFRRQLRAAPRQQQESGASQPAVMPVKDSVEVLLQTGRGRSTMVDP